MAGFFDQFTSKNTTIVDADSNVLIVGGSFPEGTPKMSLHCVVEEEHVLSSDATKHEVEDGAVFSDHLIKKPRTLTIKGIMSDDHLTLISSGITTGVGLVGNIFEEGVIAPILSGAASIISDELRAEDIKPSITALEFFEEIYEKKKLVFIDTGLKTYSNMSLKSLTIPRTPQNSRTLTFTAIFTQIMITRTGLLTLVGPTQNKDSLKQTKDGIKQTEAVSDQIQERANTLLDKIRGAVQPAIEALIESF